MSEMLDLVYGEVKSQVKSMQDLVAEYQATQDDDPNVQANAILETSDDPRLVAWREWNDKAVAAIEAKRAEHFAIAQSLVTENTSEKRDPEVIKAEHKELRDGIKSALVFLTKVPGYDAEKYPAPELPNLRGGTSKGTKGSGGKRPRLAQITVDDVAISKDVDKDGVTTKVVNFTLAAAHISKVSKSKVEVSALQRAAFDAAGTDDLSTLGGIAVDFYFESGEGENRKNFHVVAVPRADTSDEATTDEAPAAE